MRKVVHLLYSGLGGHASVFFSLVKGDKKKEYATEAIFCGIEEVRKDYIIQCEKYNIPYRSIKKKRGIDPGTYIAIYKGFRASRPQVIFLHGASLILPAILYKCLHPRTRLVVRDTQAHHLKSKGEWWWMKLAIRFSNNLVFLTRESLDGIAEKTGTDKLKKKAVIISNGLDTDLYTALPARDISKKVMIGMQSRLQPIKDHPTLLKAFAQLKQKISGRKLVLRIAGDGETMSQLLQLTKELGLEADVEFCGMLNERELLDFMHSLDIYVHATYGETMSNSIMQALACGLPMVVSNVWGVNNMIEDQLNGLLYASENVEDLCNKLEELINDPSLRSRLSANAREYAENEYSLTRLFARYSQVL